MKKLIVCGDSYMAATQDLPDRTDCLGEGHFTQILAKELGLDYDTFARGGSSNFLIYLQVKEAIKLNPDLIMVGFTDSNRVEILNAEYYDDDLDSADIDVYKFNYHEYPDLSSSLRREKWETRPRYISTSVINVIDFPENFEDKGRLFNENNLKIYKDYFTSFWSPSIQAMYSTMLMRHTIDLLKESKIEYYILGLGDPTNDRRDKRGSKNLNPQNQPGGGPYRWHTTAETQNILAKNWINYFKDLWQINN